MRQELKKKTPLKAGSAGKESIGEQEELKREKNRGEVAKRREVKCGKAIQEQKKVIAILDIGPSPHKTKGLGKRPLNQLVSHGVSTRGEKSLAQKKELEKETKGGGYRGGKDKHKG